MNAFKKSEKPSHKLYSSTKHSKEFFTDKEFVLEMSENSVDLKSSFSDLENSFFSRDSSRIDEEFLDQLKDIENLERKLPAELVEVKKNKEEETEYTKRQPEPKLENEEFRARWLCNNCIAGDKNCQVL